MIRRLIADGLVSFECELTAYRKGSLLVRVSLENGTMTWKESRQWCNNFVRSLTGEQVAELRELISAAVPPDKAAPENDPHEPDDRNNLLLTICGPGSQMTRSRAQLDPTGWNMLRKAIEKLSRVPFQL
jgi:hypothetical protein